MVYGRGIPIFAFPEFWQPIHESTHPDYFPFKPGCLASENFLINIRRRKMIKTRLLAPAGSSSSGDQSIGGYSQMVQKRKKRFPHNVFPLHWQTGEGLIWFGRKNCGIKINQLGIPYVRWERERRKVYNKLLQDRSRFADFFIKRL